MAAMVIGMASASPPPPQPSPPPSPPPPVTASPPPPPPALPLCNLLKQNVDATGMYSSCRYTSNDTGANLTWPNVTIGDFNFGMRLHVQPCDNTMTVYLKQHVSSGQFLKYRTYQFGDRLKRHPAVDITATTDKGKSAFLEIEVALGGEPVDGNLVLSLGAFVSAGVYDGLISGYKGLLPRTMIQVLNGDFTKYLKTHCAARLPPPPPPDYRIAPFFCGVLAPAYAPGGSSCADTFSGAQLSWPSVTIGNGHPKYMNFGFQLALDACGTGEPTIALFFKYDAESTTSRYALFHSYPLSQSYKRHPVIDVTYSSTYGTAYLEVLVNITGDPDALLTIDLAFGAFVNASVIDAQIPGLGADLPQNLITMNNINMTDLKAACPIPAPPPPPPYGVDSTRNAIIGYCVISAVAIIVMVVIGIMCRKMGVKAGVKQAAMTGGDASGYPALGMSEPINTAAGSSGVPAEYTGKAVVDGGS